MLKVVERSRNKVYYRILHVPIWIWVFFVLPGHLTWDLFLSGPDARHGWWLALVTLVCAWRGLAGRLPGVEPRPYITHWGEDKPNLWYRVICYTAAWVDLLVPYLINLAGLLVASFTGEWHLATLHSWLYYPLALAIVLATALDLTPRARRSTRNEGFERGCFYIAIWTVVPAQVLAWAAWRLGGQLGIDGIELARFRAAVFVITSATVLLAGFRSWLPRTMRYHAGLATGD
jgi:hypothetical protein